MTANKEKLKRLQEQQAVSEYPAYAKNFFSYFPRYSPKMKFEQLNWRDASRSSIRTFKLFNRISGI